MRISDWSSDVCSSDLGSNGGLLMGTQIVKHPDDYRAVVARVGIYDMLRHETRFANGPYNIPEYGIIADPAQFKATLAYYPLQQVGPHTAYPAVLLTNGEKKRKGQETGKKVSESVD